VNENNKDFVLGDDDRDGFNSHDCVNIIIEAEGDNTPRPPSPQQYRLGLIEREKLIRYGAMPPSPPPPPPPDMPESEGPAK
jgi:hypothetical protein